MFWTERISELHLREFLAVNLSRKYPNAQVFREYCGFDLVLNINDTAIAIEFLTGGTGSMVTAAHIARLELASRYLQEKHPNRKLIVILVTNRQVPQAYLDALVAGTLGVPVRVHDISPRTRKENVVAELEQELDEALPIP